MISLRRDPKTDRSGHLPTTQKLKAAPGLLLNRIRLANLLAPANIVRSVDATSAVN